jgi:uncharacterized protein (UPF0218 family)
MVYPHGMSTVGDVISGVSPKAAAAVKYSLSMIPTRRETFAKKFHPNYKANRVSSVAGAMKLELNY